MRLWIVYLFVSGLAMFVGATAVLVAIALPAGRKRKTVAITRRTLVLVGVAFVALSATPLPLWFYLLWAGLILAWLIGGRFLPASRRKTAIALRLAAALACVAAMAAEAPWQLASGSVPREAKTVYVVGDSISAGIDPEALTPWPGALARRTGLRVVNLAEVGAKAGSAVRQAEGLERGPAVVVIEIGGNDMLGGTSPEQFEADLERLVQAVRGPDRTLVMLELPLPPFHNRFGSAQRRVASRHGVLLLPKRLFASVLTTPGATSDGLHLSETGHEKMAETIAGLLR